MFFCFRFFPLPVCPIVYTDTRYFLMILYPPLSGRLSAEIGGYFLIKVYFSFHGGYAMESARFFLVIFDQLHSFRNKEGERVKAGLVLRSRV